MHPIRFRSRHLHATFYDDVRANMITLGWSTPPINFGTVPVTVTDFTPDERNTQVATNTVAVSLGDFGDDDDEELGAALGGLRGAIYNIYIDVYMAEQSLSLAICDDIRDMFVDRVLPLIDQITETPVPNTYIEIESILGPEKPSAQVGAEQFKKYWRTMRIDARLYYNT